jgi:putative exosortase-associated protein (TIGR04073 family)
MNESNFMRNTSFFLGAVLVAGLLVSGCTNMETKLGRGINNTLEVTRWGEMRRTKEQMSLFDGPGVGYTAGTVIGFDRSLARTGIGLLEVVTFPFPPYHPLFTDHFSVNPVYPDSYTPGIASDPKYDTDTYLGFSGGNVAPMWPNNRFAVFDTH